MRRLIALFLTVLASFDLGAACIRRLDINGENGFEASLAASAEDSCRAALVPGAVVEVDVAGTKRVFTVVKAPKDPVNIATLDASAIDQESQNTMLRVLSQQTTAKVTVGQISEDVELIVSNAGSYKEQNFALGPATRRATSESGETAEAAEDEAAQALRIRYAYVHQYRGAAVVGPTARLDLNIDTTDNDGDFIDDNFASLSGGWGGWRFGDFIADGLIGGRARYTKAIHSGDSDQDAMVTLSGAIPLLQAFHFGGSRRFATPPLSIDLNYGYRRKAVADARTDGLVFEGTVRHNIFLFDQYWLSASGTFTVNDMDDRPVTVPRTQRLYKVAISQHDNKDQKMKILVNFEDGSLRVVGKKVRQYFIGLGYEWIK
jgi:hypothetical protein